MTDAILINILLILLLATSTLDVYLWREMGNLRAADAEIRKGIDDMARILDKYEGPREQPKPQLIAPRPCTATAGRITPSMWRVSC